MTTWWDTHVHLASLAREGREAADVLERAAAAGVLRMIAVGHDPAANAASLDVAARWPKRVRAAIGYDRACAAHPPPLDELRAAFAEHDARVAAVGEIGLDYSREEADRRAQREGLVRMTALAREVGRPVIVHVRDAWDDALAILREHADAARLGERVGVIHCFTGDRALARRALDLGLCLSFSGIVTFRNADRLREAVRYVPDGRLLLETDAPYLAPVPHRGEVNEPAFLPEVGCCVARERGVDEAALAVLTAANAARLFAWAL